MKKTKKIPIMLAALTLVASMGGALSARALSGVSQDILTTAMEAGDSLGVGTNLANTPLRLDTIGYKTGTSKGSVTAPGDDWYIKKIIVAYMNFSLGILEEEADQNLATLVNNRDDNWKVVSLYEVYPWNMRRTQDISFNQAMTGKNEFANKSDILYYAVEFGRVVDDGWAETMWLRGKFDYRSCVHSSVFDEETMSCARVEEDGETIKYVPKLNADNTLVALPENEEVITWVEEWKDVVKGEAAVMQREVEQMEEYLNHGLEMLERDDVLVAGIYKSWMYYVENQGADPDWGRFVNAAEGARILRQRIAEMRKFFEVSEVDTTEIETLKQEIVVLKEKNSRLEGENATLKQENELLNNENASLSSENVVLKEENDVLKQELEQMKTQTKTMQQNIDRLELDKEESGTKNLELQQEIDRLEDEKVELSEKTQTVVTETVEVEKVVEKVVEVDRPIEVVKVVEVDKPVEVAGVTDAVLENSENEDTEKVSQAEDSPTSEMANVPVLGGEEVKTSGAWWWLIPIVGLLGVMILLVKRKFSRR